VTPPHAKPPFSLSCSLERDAKFWSTFSSLDQNLIDHKWINWDMISFGYCRRCSWSNTDWSTMFMIDRKLIDLSMVVVLKSTDVLLFSNKGFREKCFCFYFDNLLLKQTYQTDSRRLLGLIIFNMFSYAVSYNFWPSDYFKYSTFITNGQHINTCMRSRKYSLWHDGSATLQRSQVHINECHHHHHHQVTTTTSRHESHKKVLEEKMKHGD
jgi:hypothetical protein